MTTPRLEDLYHKTLKNIIAVINSFHPDTTTTYQRLWTSNEFAKLDWVIKEVKSHADFLRTNGVGLLQHPLEVVREKVELVIYDTRRKVQQ